MADSVSSFFSSLALQVSVSVLSFSRVLKSVLHGRFLSLQVSVSVLKSVLDG